MPMSTPSQDSQNTPAGAITVAQRGGVWWFIDPDGEPFVSLGVNHVEPHIWLGPYNLQATRERYGETIADASRRFNPDTPAAQRWMDGVIALAREHGFNTLGKHTHPAIPPALYEDKMYYIASMETAPIAAWKINTNKGSFPDVFSIEFAEHLSTRVREVCRRHRGSRNLLGYMYVDVPRFRVNRPQQIRPDQPPQSPRDQELVRIGMPYPWANALIERDPTSPGKQRWIDLLKRRYPNAASAAAVYGVPHTTWEDVAGAADWFGVTDPERAEADTRAFVQVIAEQWYRLHYEHIRQHDPHHLVLGDKHVDVPDWLIPILGKYVDVNVIQNVRPFGDWQAETARRLYEATGKPVMNGDGPSFSVLRPEEQRLGVKGFRAESYVQAAQLYRDYVKQAMSVPYFIGFHTCGFVEQWDGSDRGDISTNENGFLDPFERPRELIAEAIKEANQLAHGYHQQATTVLA